MKQKPEPPTGSRLPCTIGMLAVRYGIGVVMIAGGLVTLAISPAGLAVDGFAMAAGGGISVILINVMYRLSVSGEEEREREERARIYLDEHGEWPPDEQPREPQAPAGERAHAHAVNALH
jgi:hypothetical protein